MLRLISQHSPEFPLWPLPHPNSKHHPQADRIFSWNCFILHPSMAEDGRNRRAQPEYWRFYACTRLGKCHLLWGWAWNIRRNSRLCEKKTAWGKVWIHRAWLNSRLIDTHDTLESNSISGDISKGGLSEDFRSLLLERSDLTAHWSFRWRWLTRSWRFILSLSVDAECEKIEVCLADLFVAATDQWTEIYIWKMMQDNWKLQLNVNGIFFFNDEH